MKEFRLLFRVLWVRELGADTNEQARSLEFSPKLIVLSDSGWWVMHLFVTVTGNFRAKIER